MGPIQLLQCVHSRAPQQHESVYAQKNKSRNHAETVLVNPPDGAQSNDMTHVKIMDYYAATRAEPPRRFAPCRLDAYDILGHIVVENVGDNSVSSCRLRVTETQQLSYVAAATPICVEMLRHSRQPITGRLATHPDSLHNI